jgi:hypothetical protein
MTRSVKILAVLYMLSAAVTSVNGAGNASDLLNHDASDPFNATCRIEGTTVSLMNDRSELPAAPGSAMKTRTAVMGQPVFGDLDGDGDQDAALLLIHDPGGSVTFYYVAAALQTEGRYQGTNTVLLGDQIAPTDLVIQHRKVEIVYTYRHPEEPFSAMPSVNWTMTVAVQNGQLLVLSSSGDMENVTQGWVTIGHEVRSFKPCDGHNDLWLMGQSPALKAIMAAYRQAKPDPKKYRPVFMVLAGRQVDPPTHGFGADYDGAFLAARLVRVAPEASCRPESVSVDSPKPVRKKIVFDTSALDDEGLLGPPGEKRALSYEFCIPDSVEKRNEVEGIDLTVRFFSASPGRIDCADHEILCIGSTHQQNITGILQRLAELPYVQDIQQTLFE